MRFSIKPVHFYAVEVNVVLAALTGGKSFVKLQLYVKEVDEKIRDAVGIGVEVKHVLQYVRRLPEVKQSDEKKCIFYS